MYAPKIPKTQQPHKGPYIAYNPHTLDLSTRKWPNKIRIISVDPGISNFCIRVEERGLRKYCQIKTLLYHKLHLRKDEQELTDDYVCHYYTKLSHFLNQHLNLFKSCHMVIIEKQMPFNYRAVRISQHTLTYFMLHLQDVEGILAMIFEVDAKLKGKELGASSHLNSKGLKAWAVEKATELLTDRGDEESLAILVKNRKKADDLADTVCQIEALFSYNGWLTTQKPVSLSLANTTGTKIKVKSKATVKLNILNQ